jgi:hypothetical protein
MLESQKMICPDSASRSCRKRSSCCEFTGTLPRRTRERGVDESSDEGVVVESAAEPSAPEDSAPGPEPALAEAKVWSEGGSERGASGAGARANVVEGSPNAGSGDLNTGCF